MSGFEERERFSYEVAIRQLAEPTNMISHLIKNDGDTYSIVAHINCEWCDYCEEGKEHLVATPYVHKAKPDIYERVGR